MDYVWTNAASPLNVLRYVRTDARTKCYKNDRAIVIYLETPCLDRTFLYGKKAWICLFIYLQLKDVGERTFIVSLLLYLLYT